MADDEHEHERGQVFPPVERTDLPDPSITSFRGVEGERRPPWWRRWIAKVHDG